MIYSYQDLQITHPGSGSDRTIASERQNTALATLDIGGSVTCSTKKHTGCINMSTQQPFVYRS